MRCTRFRPVLLLAVAAFGLSGAEVRAGGVPYTIDILSSDFYPALQDAWMMRINNQGVAAGYIAIDSPYGPYLATTYAGGGQFQTLGIESSTFSDIVTGINDRGDVARGAHRGDGRDRLCLPAWHGQLPQPAGEPGPIAPPGPQQ